MKILVAVDGSEYTKRMLGYLTAHDELFGPAHDYTVVTAVAAVPARAAALVGKTELDDYYRETAEKVLHPVKTFFDKQGLRAHAVYEVGHAPEIIAKRADEGKFDLLVLGSHGHSALTNLVMGSVVMQVMAHCKVPVLLIR